jgi:hypothetical protein
MKKSTTNRDINVHRKLDDQIKDFLEKNPSIKDALRVFDISYDQYQKALESGYSYYSDISTSPR